MPRERTIKLSEKEYQQLRKAQRELEARKRAEMEDLEPEDPDEDEDEDSDVDWGSVPLGAVAALGAVALVSWLKNKQSNQQGNQP